MLNLDAPELQFAFNAVRQACFLARQVQAELMPEGLAKNDLSPVTVADFAAQALVGSLLEQTFPTDELVAEEDSAGLRQAGWADTLEHVSQFLERFAGPTNPEQIFNWIDRGRGTAGDQNGASGRFWTLDPVDGTKGYLRGGQYVVALALVEGGQVRLAALGCPNLSDGFRPDLEGTGSLIMAEKGAGTWVTSLASPGSFEPLHVSTRSDPALARLMRSWEAGHTNVGLIDRLMEQLHVQAEPVRMDSQAKYAVLAAGKGEIVVRLPPADRPNYRENIWDQAASALILEEAGGRVTDLHGSPLDFSTGRKLERNLGIVATNGLLHNQVLQALESMGV